MNRHGRIVAALAIGLAGIFPACSGSDSGSTGAMYIESCNLGCSDGSNGQLVTCGFTSTPQNLELSVNFSKAVRLSSVNKQSFHISDVATAAVPPGTYLLDPSNPRRVIFRPQLSFNAQGNPVFGFQANTSYSLQINGRGTGDPGPYISSTGGTENATGLACTIITDLPLVDPVPGPPIVSTFVDTVDPLSGAITTGVPANGATQVSLITKVTMVFNDLMNIGTLVLPGTGTSPSITVKIDPDGNVASTGDQITVDGSYSFFFDQLSLLTTVVFTPAQPFPSAGPSLTSPRQIIVNLPGTIKDLTGNGLGNAGPVTFTPQSLAFPPVTIPVGGEQFTNLGNCDQNRSGAQWGETTAGRLTPGLGGGSGRLGDLTVSAGQTLTLRTGPTRATGRIQLVSTGFVDGDIIDMNGVQYLIIDGFGTGNGFIEFEGSFPAWTMNNLLGELNNSVDPLLTPATYTMEGPNTLLITYDTTGDPGTSFTFDVYQNPGGVPVPSPSVVSLSGPTVPGGTAHMLEGVSAESFAAGNLLDNFDFQAAPGSVPPPVLVSDGSFEFATLTVENGATLRLEGPNPARVLVRGRATIAGVIDVSGESRPGYESDTLDGQRGGYGGPNGGDGGSGADRPDNNGSGFMAPSVEPFRPWNNGVANPGGFIQGRTGVGVGRTGTVGAGPAGQQFPSNFPVELFTLNGLETNGICESEQVGGAGGGGAYALDGGTGVAVAVSPVSLQGGSNTPPDTAGGDSGAVGLEAPGAPANKRKLTPEKGFLRGGSGGGGGGGSVEQVRTNGNGFPDPCVGGGVLINRYRSHSSGGGGGGGGSIQMQAGRTLVLGGGIDASGGDGGGADSLTPFDSAQHANPGGAGSGGAILMQSRQFLLSTIPNRLSIAGGLGGVGFAGPLGSSLGGAGGVGLARVESLTAPDPLQVAAILDPIDPLDPTSIKYLSTGAWVRSRFTPASFQGAQSCWMRPSGAFFALDFLPDVGATLGWDMDLILDLGGGEIVVPYRAPNAVLPGGQTYEQYWGQLLDRDLTLPEVGAPVVVRFQGAKLAGAMPDPCNVEISGPNSVIGPGTLTPWVRHPAELNAFGAQSDMIRFVIIFDASKLDFLSIKGVTNVRIHAQPN